MWQEWQSSRRRENVRMRALPGTTTTRPSSGATNTRGPIGPTGTTDTIGTRGPIGTRDPIGTTDTIGTRDPSAPRTPASLLRSEPDTTANTGNDFFSWIYQYFFKI